MTDKEDAIKLKLLEKIDACLKRGTTVDELYKLILMFNYLTHP